MKMYIPIITKIKVHFEEAKRNEKRLKNKELEVKNLEEEIFLLKQKLVLAEGSIIKIENETKKQNYNSCKDLENRIQSIVQDIKKELDVSKTY